MDLTDPFYYSSCKYKDTLKQVQNKSELYWFQYVTQQPYFFLFFLHSNSYTTEYKSMKFRFNKYN